MNSIDELNNLMKDVHSKAKEDSLYQGWYDFLKTTKVKLETEKYKLIFIGTKGDGKTTTILELFGLNKEMNKKNVELLLTGSGGTTVCEVELLESNKSVSYFKIDPIDVTLLNQYIDDFCLLYEVEEVTGDSPTYLPSEIARSLRNMIGLKQNEITLLRNKYKSKEEFKKEIHQRIGLKKRTKKIIECQKGKDGTFFEDCKAKFNEINLCKIPEVMLPKKIKIFLTKDILDFGHNPFLSSIVDTRGIDTILSASSDSKNSMKREDILDYIEKEQNDCLYIFVDRFTSVPSQGISELLRTRLTIGNEFRFYLLVNIKENEAEEVVTDDGKAGTMQAGIDYRKIDIIDKFKQLNIRFADQNVLFYNAKENIPSNSTLLECIKGNLNAKREELYKDCNVIERDYIRQKHSFEDHKYALDRFEQLRKDIENVYAPEKVFDHLLIAFVGVLKNVHPKRLDACNRNHGEYYACNFFQEISLVVENLFDEFFSFAKDKIINKVSDFAKFRGITELDAIHYRAFLEKFENDYAFYRSQLKEYIKSELKQRFQERTWNQAVDEFGKGIKKPTYRERVIDIYQEELRRFASKINVRDNYNIRWNKVKEIPLS